MLHSPPPQWQLPRQRGILQSPSGQSHPPVLMQILPVNTRGGTGEGAMLVVLVSSAGEGAMLSAAKAADVNRRR
jgi:hypothetical protein